MTNAILYIFSFIIGSLFGSFLNVVVDRLFLKETLIFGRSHCDHCKEPLSAKDLVPILSYLFLKARCRFCHKKLSIYYPIAEILTGLLFMGAVHVSGILDAPPEAVATWLRFSFVLTVGSCYIVILLSDAKYQIIPDKVVIPAAIFVFSYLVLSNVYFYYTYYQHLQNDPFGSFLLQAGYWSDQVMLAVKSFLITFSAAAGISLFFWFLIFITKGRGMGWGDVKLGFLIGLVNSFPLNILSIFLGFLFGSVYSLILVSVRRKSIKDTVPFGPFLVLGSVVTFVFGNQLLQWYLHLM